MPIRCEDTRQAERVAYCLVQCSGSTIGDGLFGNSECANSTGLRVRSSLSERLVVTAECNGVPRSRTAGPAGNRQLAIAAPAEGQIRGAPQGEQVLE